MPKKQAVFGQLTLTGEVAVDWMKAGTMVDIGKVEIGPIEAFPEYNIPEWANERSGDIALIHPSNKYENPILVTQRSILRVLEIWCVEKENEGCETAIEKTSSGCQKAVLILDDGVYKYRFDRDESKGKFAPYEMNKMK